MKQCCFTTEFDPITRRIITPSHICQAYNLGDKRPHPALHNIQALWDTGASITTISEKIAHSLGLVPIGFENVAHAQGVGKAKVYKVNILLPNGIEFHSLRVLEGNLTGFDVLIGMDIITNGDFAITHSDGKTTFTFRIPSVEKLDFVESPSKAAAKPLTPITTPKKVERNDPCPCGSGKKYKKCCGKS